MAQQQRYKVLEKIASGGMAEVFRAESAGLEGFKKTVAIKRVLPHLSEKKQFIGMFLDEARLSAHLSHSNCVQVFDIGVGDNTYFIVMEYVDGADLKAIIEQSRKTGQPLQYELAAAICVRLCEGLSYAHELKDGRNKNLGIVHRDMSPPNVLITRHGEVKIVDFGLAKANSQLEHSEPGIIKGKFSYLSPEAALGQPIDHRTDIFAVGIILWEMLAGRRLFQGESDLETVRQVQAARVPDIKQFNPYVTPELETVLARALARDPTQRYQRARDLGQDLNSMLFHAGRPVSSFDIAQLVEPLVRARENARRQEMKKSIIGALIEDALFEFTSLQGGGGGGSGDGGGANDRSSADLGAIPLNIGAFHTGSDPGAPPDWGSELSARQQLAPPSGSHELVSLADALEADTLSGRRQTSNAPPASHPMQSPPVSVPQPMSQPYPQQPVPSYPPQQIPKSGGGKGGIIALILVIVLLGGAVGAYFAGLIPANIIPR
jgi:serine/threonine-protein kinase